MKTMKVAFALFAVCFILGMGLIAAYPGDANAFSIPDPDPPCNTQCSKIVCMGQDGCGYDYRHYNCYMSTVAPMGCTGPFDCRCRFVGCGGACVGV